MSLGTSDTVFACTPHPAPRPSHVFRSPTGEFMSLVCFRNGSLAREWIRFEHRLDWDGVLGSSNSSRATTATLMLPWLETETTPHVPHAGVRRFGFDRVRCRHERARTRRRPDDGDGQSRRRRQPPSHRRIIATGGAATNRAILQVMANVFGVDVYRLDVENSAALGAALRAYHADRLAAGEPVSWKTVVSGFTEPNPGHRVSPNPKLVAMYEELRARVRDPRAAPQGSPRLSG